MLAGLLSVLVVFETILVILFLKTEFKKRKLQKFSDLLDAFIKVLLKNAATTIISTIVLTVLTFLFVHSNPGTAVIVVAIWMIEILAFCLSIILTLGALFLYWCQTRGRP